MERINRKDVEQVVELIAKHYPDTKLDLQVGSPTYGHAWRLNFMLDYPENHGLTSFPGLSNGYLGWSAREAYQTLRGILAGMEAARLRWGVELREAVENFPVIPNGGRSIRDIVTEMAPPTEF